MDDSIRRKRQMWIRGRDDTEECYVAMILRGGGSGGDDSDRSGRTVSIFLF